jgi:hypothetical protein
VNFSDEKPWVLLPEPFWGRVETLDQGHKRTTLRAEPEPVCRLNCNADYVTELANIGAQQQFLCGPMP